MPPAIGDRTDVPPLRDYFGVAAVDAIAELHRKGELELQRQRWRAGRRSGRPAAGRPLMALAESHRHQGNFPAAIEIYEQVVAERLGDWRKAAWLRAMLRQERLPFVPPSGVWPAPFVRVENFLPRTEQERVLAIALSLAPRFRKARLGRGEHRRVNESKRRGLAIESVGCEALHGLLAPRIAPLLSSIQERLRLGPKAPRFTQLALAAYPHGGFGVAHSDGGPRAYPQLRLNAVYFFHRQPLAFAGGDLLLYDTDIENGTPSRFAFSRIAPTSNSLVLLPPSYFHAVTQVASRSRALHDARLSALLSIRWRRAKGRTAAERQTAPHGVTEQ